MSLLVRSIISIAVILGIGFASGMITRAAIPNWYSHLQKPTFNPPDWVFGPAWSILYILIGIAFARLWHFYKDNQLFKTAMILFAVQLALNFLWTFIFFGMKNVSLALAEIFGLWAVILACILQFNKIDRPAAILFVPYLLWVSFATLLNFMIWKLNPEL